MTVLTVSFHRHRTTEYFRLHYREDGEADARSAFLWFGTCRGSTSRPPTLLYGNPTKSNDFVTAILLNSQIYRSRPSNTAMDKGSSLRGACSCGRNHYLIALSSNPSESLQVLYDDRADHSTLFNYSVNLVCDGTNRQP